MRPWGSEALALDEPAGGVEGLLDVPGGLRLGVEPVLADQMVGGVVGSQPQALPGPPFDDRAAEVVSLDARLNARLDGGLGGRLDGRLDNRALHGRIGCPDNRALHGRIGRLRCPERGAHLPVGRQVDRGCALAGSCGAQVQQGAGLVAGEQVDLHEVGEEFDRGDAALGELGFDGCLFTSTDCHARPAWSRRPCARGS